MVAITIFEKSQSIPVYSLRHLTPNSPSSNHFPAFERLQMDLSYEYSTELGVDMNKGGVLIKLIKLLLPPLI